MIYISVLYVFHRITETFQKKFKNYSSLRIEHPTFGLLTYVPLFVISIVTVNYLKSKVDIYQLNEFEFI